MGEIIMSIFKIGDEVKIKKDYRRKFGGLPKTGVIKSISAINSSVLLSFNDWGKGHGPSSNEWWVFLKGLKTIKE